MLCSTIENSRRYLFLFIHFFIPCLLSIHFLLIFFCSCPTLSSYLFFCLEFILVFMFIALVVFLSVHLGMLVRYLAVWPVFLLSLSVFCFCECTLICPGNCDFFRYSIYHRVFRASFSLTASVFSSFLVIALLMKIAFSLICSCLSPGFIYHILVSIFVAYWILVFVPKVFSVKFSVFPILYLAVVS